MQSRNKLDGSEISLCLPERLECWNDLKPYKGLKFEVLKPPFTPIVLKYCEETDSMEYFSPLGFEDIDPPEYKHLRYQTKPCHFLYHRRSQTLVRSKGNLTSIRRENEKTLNKESYSENIRKPNCIIILENNIVKMNKPDFKLIERLDSSSIWEMVDGDNNIKIVAYTSNNKTHPKKRHFERARQGEGRNAAYTFPNAESAKKFLLIHEQNLTL